MKNRLILIATIVTILAFMVYIDHAAYLMEQAAINANQ